MDVRIPFAVDKETGALVEVGDVPQGRRCNCLCPSCSQGVVAKHGEINAWHFAHDSHAVDKPIKECDISFDSCCRQFAMEMMLAGDITTLRTPDWILEERGLGQRIHSVCVTRGRVLEGMEFRSDPRFDLTCAVAAQQLYIHFDYSARQAPELKGVSSGVLQIDLRAVKQQYYAQQSEPGLIASLIRALIEGGTDSKRWLQHPSHERARAELRRKVSEEKAPYIPPQPPCDDDWDLACIDPAPPTLFESRPEKSGIFSCVMCSGTWKGKPQTHRNCPTCKTHLYATFTPD